MLSKWFSCRFFEFQSTTFMDIWHSVCTRVFSCSHSYKLNSLQTSCNELPNTWYVYLTILGAYECSLSLYIDAGQILNLSMFEQNGNCGYVLKPSVFYDKEHPQYGHFNPSVIEREGSCYELTITVRYELILY